jgi:hypothetical protein
MCAYYDFFDARCCTQFWHLKILKYLRNENLRGRQMEKIINNPNEKFLKLYWDHIDSKPIQFIINLLSPGVTIFSKIKIQPQPLRIFDIEIQVPNSHIGPKIITCHLISAKKRRGMRCGMLKKTHEPSKSLLLYLHGGGFIAQSTKSGTNLFDYN